MNKKKYLARTALLIIPLTIANCHSSPYKECSEISLKTNNETVPAYNSKEIKDKNITGYIAKSAIVSFTSGCKKSQKVKVEKGSKIAGSEVWVSSENLSCKK